LPPDTNAAVGGNFIAETVNVEYRVWDKAGNQLLDEPLSTLFGQGTGGDPYVEYDAAAGHWYVTAIDGADASKELLAISNNADPTAGFANVYAVPVAASGDLADFAKVGYNADAIVIEANDFGDGHSVVTAVDKAQAIGGTLVFYQSTPSFNARALVPAQMHDANPGDPMWFIAAPENFTSPPTIVNPNAIRVTRMDNVLTSSPTYTDYSVAVQTYGEPSNFGAAGSYGGSADQPGAPKSVATNDTTTTAVDYLGGKMVTAFSATDPSDGFATTHVHWYQVDVSGGTPSLVQEGVVNPGPGVYTYFGSATQDSAGNIGITYMESSLSEYVSAYVAGHIAGQPLGSTTAGTVFAPGGGKEFASFRNGDYSTVVLDPSDGKTFWAANEYVGSDGSSDIWRTKIVPFTVVAAVGTDYYSVNANAGDNLHFATSTPAEDTNDSNDPADEFQNNFYPELLLYDQNGNLVAIANGNASDGRNSVIDFTVPDGGTGTWKIEVTASPSTAQPTTGEYGLLATGATGALSSLQVTSTNPPDGALLQPPTNYVVTFNHTILATSLTPGELTINGVPALAVTYVDAHTVDWTIDPTSIPNGERVLNTAVISADASGNRVTDVSGAQLADFTSTFTTDNVPPTVTNSSIAEGTVFSPSPQALTEVVTFSEPMDTSFTTASSFDLHGNYRNQDFAADSFSWDATGTILTINYSKVVDDTYTLTLFAGGFQDLVGLQLASDFTVNFAVTFGSAAFPTPLTPVPPLGDLIYTGSDSHVLATSTDVDSLTLALNAGESLTLVGAPTNSAQTLTLTVMEGSTTIGSATAPAAGQNVYLQTVPIATTDTYTIQISDAGGALGLYDINAYLNTLLKVGTANLSIATAIDLTPSSYVNGPGNADRLAVVGQLPSDIVTAGSVFVSSRYYGFYNSAPAIADVLRLNAQGQVTKVMGVNDGLYYSLSGVELDPANNMLYVGVTTSFNGFGGPGSGSVTGDLVEFNPMTGAQVAIIPLPVDNSNFFYYYPYGFSIASDGTFWIAQPNSQNIIHLDANYNLMQSYSVSGILPESSAIGTDGNVYIGALSGPNGSGVYQLNPNTSAVNFFAGSPLPQINSTVPPAINQGIWNGDWYGGQRYDYSGNFKQGIGFYGTTQVQNDIYGNEWNPNFYYFDVFKWDPNGNEIFGDFVPGPIGVTTWGADNPNPPPQDTQDYYSFALTAGQSATIAVESLNGMAAHVTLVDGSGNVLATGVGGSTNVSEYIQNFVAGSAGTYYAEVTGDPGVKYSLTVTRSSNFDIEPHSTIYTAQPLTGTNGVLGALDPGGQLVVGSQIEGIDFNGSNCGCLPPDTNVAEANGYIAETVNIQFRVYATSGAILVDEPLQTLFNGNFSGGDPYIVYDDIANRWYVEGLDSSDGGFFLNVSNDNTPIHGWTMFHLVNGLGGPITDYPKMGFNKDAVFISYNNFGSGGAAATVVSIDKGALLGGTLTYYVSTPPVFQFRAMPPAQMHGDTTGGIEWFVSTDGSDFSGNTIRVTELTNYLSNSPVYTLTSLPVTPYQQGPFADQPGGPGSITTFPGTTTTQVQYRNGKLVSTMASALAGDGFTYQKGLYYEIDVSGGSPVLDLQGVIDPGPGVAVQMPSVAIDSHGNLGFTWFESSLTEYMSMWVGSLDTMGHFSSFDAAPGGGFFYASFRIGDYSTTVVDPTDGTTFWSANEYIGSDGASDIWRTHITSFSLPPAVNDDWYSINVAAGNSLYLQSYTPSDQGGQFPNTASVNLELYDTFGNLVATGSVLGDGRNESIFFNAPITGQYFVHVFNNPGSAGEYYLQVDTASYAAGDISGTVYNDLNGSGSITPSDPGLDNWEVDLFDSNGNFVASQLSHGGGNYDFGGLAPGTYTVSEFLMSGWTETQPVNPDNYTVTVTANTNSSGWNFGNFQNITISGMKFNDLTGIGTFLPGDPGLQGWTIDLLNATGAIVAQTTTDQNGDYSFTDVGPGTYTVQEELQPGWIQTFPAPPGTYTLTAASGGDQSGLDFGNFQLMTFSGTVYNDLNGNGAFDVGEPGLQGWTVNLLDAMGNLVATTTSAGDGSYSFGNVGPGQYTISEVHQDGWYQTEPVDPPGTWTVQAISSTNPSGLDFGNFQLVNVTGEVYNDVNGNGNLDPGEPGLQGWTVNLEDTSGNIVATTTSDATGDYAFYNLFPGTFIVADVLQAGWTQTQPVPNPPGDYVFTTQSGTNETGLNFGNASPATFEGTVYNDLNGDGIRESGEPALANWTVDLIYQGTTVATTTSDSNGHYIFTNVAPQANPYTIHEEVQSGWGVTQPTTIDYSETALSGGDTTGLDFGNFKLISVSGNVYSDQNGNGIRDNGEPGLAGWTVNLLNTNTGVLVSVNTDASGNYSFTGVGPGAYTLAEVVQTNYVQTQPLWPTFYSFNAVSGHNIGGAVFGDHYSPAIANVFEVIDNGQAGYSETGTWANGSPGGFNGNNRVARTTHGNGGRSTATWDFSSIANGRYDVWVTFARGTAHQSTAAPFTVYDGGTSLGTIHFNEGKLVTDSSQPPTQGSYGGVGWLEIGTFTIHNGEVKVVLNNHASQNYVDADGVLIVQHSTSPGLPAAPGSLLPSSGPSGGGIGGGSSGSGAAVGTLGVTQVTPALNIQSSMNGQAPTVPTIYISPPTASLLSVDPAAVALTTSSLVHPAVASGTSSANMAAAVLAGQTSGPTGGSTQTSSAALAVQPAGISTDLIDQMVRGSSINTFALVDYLFASTQKQNSLGDFTDTLTLGQL
jgi:hypothetical protein